MKLIGQVTRCCLTHGFNLESWTVFYVYVVVYGKLSNNRQGKANVSIMCDSYYTSTHVGTFCFSVRQKWCDDQF